MSAKTTQDRPHKHVKYLALALYYWGSGETQEEAVKKMRKAGFSGRITSKNKALLYVFPEGTEDPYVDNMGGVNWYLAEGWNWRDVPDPQRFWIQSNGALKPA